jgi:4-hydroxymandelate oxidase
MKTTRRGALRSALGAAAACLAPWSARAFGQAWARGGQITAAPNPLPSLPDYERVARERMSEQSYAFVAGGAADELTLRANREAYDRILLNPRVLVDVSRLDTRVTILGRALPHPILLAPTGYHRLLHPDGEVGTAQGASAAGATFVLSSFSTTAVEDVAAATRSPLWFQMYVQPDRGFTRELVRRVEAAGCQALCLTVDTPSIGARDRMARAGFAVPPGMVEENVRRPGAPAPALLDPSLSWKDVEWLRSFAKVPVLLKGVLNADDAARGLEAGAAGIIVSNHGARNLDTVPATIQALPRVVERIEGRIPVLVDGGIRRGTDVVKALALGANAVLIGRPYLYGLTVGGGEGVTRVVGILRSELEMAMALTGRPTIALIDRSVLWSTEGS